MKENVILVAKDGRPSMLKVYGQMNSGKLKVRRRLRMKNGGEKIFYRNYDNNNPDVLTKTKEINLHDSVVIRWGTREVVNTNEGTIVYNKADAIKKATHKGRSRTILAEAGVRVPKAVTPTNFSENDLPVVARPPVHAKGKNFVVLRTRQEFENHYHANIRHEWYYSAFIDKDKEYRVHVAHGKVLALMEKPRPVDNKVAWNRAQNADAFEYVGYDQYENPGIKDSIIQAIKSVDALGLDFGGVDVMVKNNVAYVLEVNTSPTLNSSDYVSTRWSEYFDWLFRKDVRRPHINKLDYQRAKNFFWWHEQLKDEKPVENE